MIAICMDSILMLLYYYYYEINYMAFESSPRVSLRGVDHHAMIK